MLFAIDFDTRQVECIATTEKSEEQLSQYWFDNDLENAVALVEDSESIMLQFDILEMEDLAANLHTAHKYEKFYKEDEAAERCWRLLVSKQEDFPEFTPRLGKKLLKEAAKRCNEKPMKKVEGKAKTPTKKKSTSKPKVTSKKFTDETVFAVGTVAPRPNTSYEIIVNCIEANLGEATIQEIADLIQETEIDLDLKLLNGYIRGALNSNRIKVA